MGKDIQVKCQKSGCNAYAMKASSYCFAHNPEAKDEHLKAVKKGGESTLKAKMTLAPPVDLSQTKNLLELLQETINQVRVVNPNGSVDVKAANTIGFLTSKIVELKKQLVLEAETGSDVDMEEFKRWKHNDELTSARFEENPQKAAKEWLELAVGLYDDHRRQMDFKGESVKPDEQPSVYTIKQLKSIIEEYEVSQPSPQGDLVANGV